MAADARTLARIHRVRTLQLTLARAEESRARDAVATETAMSARIAQLAEAVAPVSGGAVTLGAAAHYRERLNSSALAAAARVRAAEADAGRAAQGARGARQDQSAVEKLIERAGRDTVRREMRELEQVGLGRKRHGPC
ncbi:MAG TPA: hypothetical protein VF592_02725 [Sphingomonas sp.]|jgi:hypothetical protein|uniref:hypothetical protein n=1 Tax=Sphingomonas sp. TaxID=28214 RepID=UPI002ED7D200